MFSAPTHPFSPATKSDKRAPCPALNVLANHGYLPRSGTNITFVVLIRAITTVYNMSLPLALFLSIPAFLIYGKAHFPSTWKPWTWFIAVDLDTLAKIGHLTIAHYASLVHPNEPSNSPDPAMLQDLLARVSCPSANEKSETYSSGLTLADLAHIRVIRESALRPPMSMDYLHKRIALGESSLLWLTLYDRSVGAIPRSRLEQWLGEERLPDGWWTGVRPRETIGLLGTRKGADEVKKEMENILA